MSWRVAAAIIVSSFLVPALAWAACPRIVPDCRPCKMPVCIFDGDTSFWSCEPDSTKDEISCTDNNACTTGDHCSAGACVGTPITCMAVDQCHDAGTCNTSTGVCSNPNKANGAACNDGNACTQGEENTVGSKPTTMSDKLNASGGDERMWYMQVLGRAVPILQPMSGLHDFWGRSFGPMAAMNNPGNVEELEGWGLGYQVTNSGWFGNYVINKFVGWTVATAWTYGAILDRGVGTYGFSWLNSMVSAPSAWPPPAANPWNSTGF